MSWQELCSHDPCLFHQPRLTNFCSSACSRGQWEEQLINLHKCISTWHKLKALHRFRVCAFKGWQGGSIWTKGREREQGKVLSHSSWESNSRTCEAANNHGKSKEHNFQDQVGFRSRIQHYIYQIVMPGFLHWFHLLSREQYVGMSYGTRAF